MKTSFFTTCLLLTMASGVSAQQKAIPASFADYDAYEQLVKEVKEHRDARLLPLDKFLEKAKEPRTIILDARSKEMYDLKHVKGAVHLNFSDFTQQALDTLIARYGGPETQILIYCNNNFRDKLRADFMDAAFITKVSRPGTSAHGSSRRPITLALNIPAYINLYGYGYRNVYELSELVDVHDERIAFEGSFATQLPEDLQSQAQAPAAKNTTLPQQ